MIYPTVLILNENLCKCTRTQFKLNLKLLRGLMQFILSSRQLHLNLGYVFECLVPVVEDNLLVSSSNHCQMNGNVYIWAVQRSRLRCTSQNVFFSSNFGDKLTTAFLSILHWKLRGENLLRRLLLVWFVWLCCHSINSILFLPPTTSHCRPSLVLSIHITLTCEKYSCM